jgi:hypothetical protein
MAETLAERIARPDLVNLPEWRVAEILNAPDASLPTAKGPVDTKDAQELLLATGEWSGIVIAADSAATPLQLRGLAIVMRDTIRQSGTIRMEVPHIYTAVTTAIAGLVAAGLISEATRVALLALADQPQSWAEANNVEVTARSVGLARGGI